MPIVEFAANRYNAPSFWNLLGLGKKKKGLFEELLVNDNQLLLILFFFFFFFNSKYVKYNTMHAEKQKSQAFKFMESKKRK